MKNSEELTLFLCGDVMIGRGIDQILPHHVDPKIHEFYLKNAIRYIELAEKINGPIPHPVEFSYIWGEALEELARVNPQARIVNLETSVTESADWQDKGINYRMHPGNTPVLTAAKVDVCVLANNHVLDWGVMGLQQTLSTLHQAGIKTSGAGANLKEAQAPAVVAGNAPGRILVFSMAAESSGVPQEWRAGERPGVNLLLNFSKTTVRQIKAQIQKLKHPQDLVVISIHWGGNWGYEIPAEHRQFARDLIDEANVDIIHGHSSHHILGLEVYQGKLILYGCGDFISDYEGIGSHEEYRGDLSVMFFPRVDTRNGKLRGLRLVPFHLKKFRLEKATSLEVQWLKEVLNREGQSFGTSFMINADQSLQLIL
ncbi:MAG: CapA family protein [Bacillota bacterium]